MKQQMKAKAAIIKFLSIILIIVNLAILFLPVLTFTKTVEAYGITETLTIKTSFLNIVLNSACDITSSLGGGVIETIEIEKLWLIPEQYNQIKLMIIYVGVNYIIAIGLLGYSVVSNYTNNNHLWYMISSTIIFLMISIYACMSINPSSEEIYFALEFPVVAFIVVIAANLIVVLIADKFIEQIKENAVDTFFGKYKNQSDEFKDDLIANFSECIGESRYESALEVLSIITGAVAKMENDKTKRTKSEE